MGEQQTDKPVLVTIPLGNGDTYTLSTTPGMLRRLGPAILSHLGCSYEIRWPGATFEEKQAAVRRRRERRNEAAQEYAWRNHFDEREREIAEAAFRAGYEAAPKPVNVR